MHKEVMLGNSLGTSQDVLFESVPIGAAHALAGRAARDDVHIGWQGDPLAPLHRFHMLQQLLPAGLEPAERQEPRHCLPHPEHLKQEEAVFLAEDLNGDLFQIILPCCSNRSSAHVHSMT